MFNINFCKNTRQGFAKDLRRARREIQTESDKKHRDEVARLKAAAQQIPQATVYIE